MGKDFDDNSLSFCWMLGDLEVSSVLGYDSSMSVLKI